jgi:hypothetical protein
MKTMNRYREHDSAREVFHLRERLSEGSLNRQTPDGQLETYRIINEWEVEGRHYAILQRHDDPPENARLFRMHGDFPHEIDDEAEWERVVDVVDEMLYFHDS